ncbi:hypothetical protein ACJ41O_012857 [Fusarium nematophilum]
MSHRVTIHCIRHAEGFHNLGEEFFNLPDPHLTPLGEDQCAKLRETLFTDQSKVKLVASSPMTRAIHTAFLVFQPTLQEQQTTRILALPDAQEVFDYGCDIGSDVHVLKGRTEHHGWPVDLDMVHIGWNNKALDGRYSPVSSALEARAREARRLLKEKAKELAQEGDEEVHIVLVAHGSFLHFFTNDWEDSSKLCGTGWSNCDARSYVFEDFESSDKDDDAWLLETSESRSRRGLRAPACSVEEQQGLFHKAMDEWILQGLPDLRSAATASVLA